MQSKNPDSDWLKQRYGWNPWHQGLMSSESGSRAPVVEVGLPCVGSAFCQSEWLLRSQVACSAQPCSGRGGGGQRCLSSRRILFLSFFIYAAIILVAMCLHTPLLKRMLLTLPRHCSTPGMQLLPRTVKLRASGESCSLMWDLAFLFHSSAFSHLEEGAGMVVAEHPLCNQRTRVSDKRLRAESPKQPQTTSRQRHVACVHLHVASVNCHLCSCCH